MLQLLVFLIRHKSALNYFQSLLLPNQETKTVKRMAVFLQCCEQLNDRHLLCFTIVHFGTPFFFLLFGKSIHFKSFCICKSEHSRGVFSGFIFEFPLTDFCLCEQQTHLINSLKIIYAITRLHIGMCFKVYYRLMFNLRLIIHRQQYFC